MASKLGIYEYNIMPLNEQADYLWDNGTFLANRVKGTMKIQLHSLSNFYVEVFYKSKENKIIELKPFKAVRCLEPYLDQIDVNQLH